MSTMLKTGPALPAADDQADVRQSTVDKHDIYIGRQPIYDSNLNVFAYELLYRTGLENRAGSFDGDLATSQVVVNAFMEIGLNQVVGNHLSFINLTRSFLVGHNPVPFPKERLVLEVLENARLDDELINGITNLAAEGYIIALDDFVYHESKGKLVELAQMIKIDVLALDRDTIKRHVEELREYPVKLVAEKVETQEDYEFCKQLGFEYFQGYFLCRPKVIKGHRTPTNRIATLRLLGKLQDLDVQARELEELISQDVVLSYKLLRYINSAFFNLPRQVESIGQAVVYLGNRTIKTWVTLIVLSGIDDKPHELMTTALIRGKMCELLALHAGKLKAESDFTVGLFSALDALIDTPMSEIVQSLPLTDEVSAALQNQEGDIGRRLRCTLDYERGDWEAVATFGLKQGEVTDVYLQAIAWADQISRGLRG